MSTGQKNRSPDENQEMSFPIPTVQNLGINRNVHVNFQSLGQTSFVGGVFFVQPTVNVWQSRHVKLEIETKIFCLRLFGGGNPRTLERLKSDEILFSFIQLDRLDAKRAPALVRVTVFV